MAKSVGVWAMEQSNPLWPGHRTKEQDSTFSALGLSTVPPFAWLLLAALGLSLFGSTGSLLAWGLVAVWVLRGPGQAVESIWVGMVLVFLNSAVFSVNNETLTLRWIILLIAAARVAFAWAKHGFGRPRWLLTYFVFVVYLLVHSVLVSEYPILSVFKVLSFAVMTLTVYFGIALGKRDWGANVAAFGVILTLLSLPLLALPAGYLRNGHQFQGILSHPQSFGVILAVPFAYLVGLWVLEKKSGRRLLQLGVLTIMAAMLVLSGARSGYLAALIAILITTAWHYVRQPGKTILSVLFHPLTYFFLAALAVVVGFFDLADNIESFLFERDMSAYAAYGVWLDDSSGFAERLFASRQNLSDASWENFLERPWLGIGLGVPSSLFLPAATTSIGAFVVSAPVEKGFFVTAVLEELGGVGLLLFILFTVMQFTIILRSQRVAVVCLAFAALLITTGEFIYFSAGGIGILVHIGIGIGLAAGET